MPAHKKLPSTRKKAAPKKKAAAKKAAAKKPAASKQAPVKQKQADPNPPATKSQPTLDLTRRHTHVGSRGRMVYLQDGYGFDVNGNCMGKVDEQGELVRPEKAAATE